VKPRHVAQLRLDRPVVGEGSSEPRALPVRLDGRSHADLPWESFRLGAGDGMVWDHRPVPISPFKMPNAGPNAPLLKRVVRHPYAMEPSRPARSVLFDASRPDRSVDRGDAVKMVFRMSRDARNLEAPLPMDHAPEHRAHPFARRRHAEEDAP
jgi:hypothetical protein